VSTRRKLIVVSNRGPVSFARDGDGNRVARRGGGGLVTALRGLVTHHDVSRGSCIDATEILSEVLETTAATKR